MTANLRILSSKADSNAWDSFTRSELKLESVHQESPRSDIFRRRHLQKKHRQKHLTWAKEKNYLEHFVLPSADKLYGDADFIFQQDLAPAHTAKGTKSWLW